MKRGRNTRALPRTGVGGRVGGAEYLVVDIVRRDPFLAWLPFPFPSLPWPGSRKEGHLMSQGESRRPAGPFADGMTDGGWAARHPIVALGRGLVSLSVQVGVGARQGTVRQTGRQRSGWMHAGKGRKKGWVRPLPACTDETKGRGRETQCAAFPPSVPPAGYGGAVVASDITASGSPRFEPHSAEHQLGPS